MKANYLRDIEIGKLISMMSRPDGNEMIHFRESVHNNPYSIVSSVRSRKSCDKIHPDFIPLPVWDLQWLQQLQRDAGAQLLPADTHHTWLLITQSLASFHATRTFPSGLDTSWFLRGE